MAQLGCRVLPQPDDPVEVPHIMRAFDFEVFDAVWAAVEPLLPERADEHPLGCHRRRVSDRICFEAMLIRLVTGCSWVDVERLVQNKVSDTTLRARRDEWIQAEVFEQIATEALCAYDRVIGLDLSEVSIDGSLHKAPAVAKGPGKALLTGASSAGSGRSRPMPTASRSGGRLTVRTATTACCCRPRSR
jgi:transposase